MAVGPLSGNHNRFAIASHAVRRVHAPVFLFRTKVLRPNPGGNMNSKLLRLLAGVTAGCAALDSLPAQTEEPVTHALVRDLFIDGNRELFSPIPGLLPLRNGGVAVPQPADHAVLIYSGLGKVVMRFGAAGEGPGEFRMLGPLSTTGSTIVAVDPALRRQTILSTSGALLSTRPFALRLTQGNTVPSDGSDARLSVPISAFPDGSTLRLAFPMQGFEGPEWLHRAAGASSLVVVDQSGAPRHLVAVVPESPSRDCTQTWQSNGAGGGFAVPFCASPLVGYADNGAFIAVLRPLAPSPGRTPFHLTVIESSGDTAFSLVRSRPSVPVSRQDVDSALRALRSRRIGPQGGALPPPALAAISSMKVPAFRPSVRRLLVDRNGGVALELEDGHRHHTWMVIDARGIETGRFVLPPNSRLQAIADGVLWSIEEDSGGAEHVIRYSLVPR